MKLYVHHTTQKNQAKGLFNGIVAASLMLAPANVEPVHAQVFTAVAARQTKTTSSFQEPYTRGYFGMLLVWLASDCVCLVSMKHRYACRQEMYDQHTTSQSK